jgi:hypothetical protein
MFKCLIISSTSNNDWYDLPVSYLPESVSLFDILSLSAQSAYSIIEFENEKEYNEMHSAINYHNERAWVEDKVCMITIKEPNETHKLIVNDRKAFLKNIEDQRQQEKIKDEETKVKRSKQKLKRELAKAGYTTDEINEIINKKFGVENEKLDL